MNTLPSCSTAALETWCFKTFSTKIIKTLKEWWNCVWSVGVMVFGCLRRVTCPCCRPAGRRSSCNNRSSSGSRPPPPLYHSRRSPDCSASLAAQRERESSNCSTRPRLTSDITSDIKYLKVLVSSLRFVPQRIQLILLTDQIYWTFALFHLVTVTNSDGKM